LRKHRLRKIWCDWETEKMHKRLLAAVAALTASVVLAGCGDSAGPSGAPSEQPAAAKTDGPAAAKSTEQAGDTTKNPQIVRGGLRFIAGYEAGYAAAAAQKKPMLLFFTASWCHYCHQLAADAFNDATVVNLSERFVCVLVDADREPQVCAYFRVRSYPTIQFVSARGQLLNRMVGKRPGRELSRQMHAALQTFARTSDDTQSTR
jgi:thiol-disulfide isomerase/thioredoxin